MLPSGHVTLSGSPGGNGISGRSGPPGPPGPSGPPGGGSGCAKEDASVASNIIAVEENIVAGWTGNQQWLYSRIPKQMDKQGNARIGPLQLCSIVFGQLCTAS
ncbi:unnamed protein product [Cylicostephanus goldi]|uniref:Uncharacterized protein n=1 Tax=Cylicostephanus goldi TaxID=71465 RepID=A0A3P7MGN5_CYLGO|nr:unnamed protein product [Cylicostephanus goldi]